MTARTMVEPRTLRTMGFIIDRRGREWNLVGTIAGINRE
jgi:hypothetical protein